MARVLRHGSLTKRGNWTIHYVSGQTFALFSCPDCGRIDRIADLAGIQESVRAGFRDCLCGCSGDLVLTGWDNAAERSA